jgi:hypothetical protein
MNATAATVAMCGLVSLVTLTAAHVYDRLFKRHRLLLEAWSDVAAVLRQRHDLARPLVEVVRRHGALAMEALEELTHAHSTALGATAAGVRERAAAEEALSSAFHSLLARLQPLIGSTAELRLLVERLAAIDGRLLVARCHYDVRVREYDAARRAPLSTLLAATLTFGPAEPFEPRIDAPGLTRTTAIA